MCHAKLTLMTAALAEARGPARRTRLDPLPLLDDELDSLSLISNSLSQLVLIGFKATPHLARAVWQYV